MPTPLSLFPKNNNSSLLRMSSVSAMFSTASSTRIWLSYHGTELRIPLMVYVNVQVCLVPVCYPCIVVYFSIQSSYFNHFYLVLFHRRPLTDTLLFLVMSVSHKPMGEGSGKHHLLIIVWIRILVCALVLVCIGAYSALVILVLCPVTWKHWLREIIEKCFQVWFEYELGTKYSVCTTVAPSKQVVMYVLTYYQYQST